jgi:hypothetical protein
MEFDDEYSLQAFICFVIGGTREVTLDGNNRIDLMTDAIAMEIKPRLDPGTIDLAAGQLQRYTPFIGNRRRVIAGLTPKRYDKSVTDRADAHKAMGVEVWFIDQIPQFTSAYPSYHSRFGTSDPTRNDGIAGNVSTIQNNGTNIGAAYSLPPMVASVSQPMGMYPQMGYSQGNYPQVGNGQFRSMIQPDSTLGDILTPDEPKRIQLYKADAMSGVYVVLVGFLLIFLSISAVGLGVAYIQGRMPIHSLQVLFQREEN